MISYSLTSIGTITKNNDESTLLHIKEEFIPGIKFLQGFSHLVVLYWCHLNEETDLSDILTIKKPYRTGPDSIGVFATRSPFRPNPLAVSTAAIKNIQYDTGIISFYYLDAESGTPVLDIKPYIPCLDRSDSATVPDWCKHWPKNLEQSDEFDWNHELNV
ncbi:TPA: TrmO family methyltransferase [Klebsiella oxytoca]